MHLFHCSTYSNRIVPSGREGVRLESRVTVPVDKNDRDLGGLDLDYYVKQE